MISHLYENGQQKFDKYISWLNMTKFPLKYTEWCDFELLNFMMSHSKKIRMGIFTSSSRNLSQDIFFNIDLLSIIFLNFRIIEILSIIQTNKFLYNYIKKNEKSLVTVKRCIKYDFGNIQDLLFFYPSFLITYLHLLLSYQ